ncbi:hypothetical protein EYC84_004853 [Monilinia fructicola]|uniref:Uncharacterized protein n=1 Tax=Monilinia fructicola TaxID=38448 RepID=A0A5M9K1R3_MONFR|nr:hypothetical protein EYC84_004853 [Monilinia fructicola]
MSSFSSEAERVANFGQQPKHSYFERKRAFIVIEFWDQMLGTALQSPGSAIFCSLDLGWLSERVEKNVD